MRINVSFPTQNDNFFADQPGVLEKAHAGDGKTTYFQVWSYIQSFIMLRF